MAHSEDWARRLVRRLPADPEALLEEGSRYVDQTVLPLFLDHLEELIFRDPRTGLKYAKVAPRLARLILSPEPKRARGQIVKAHAILAGAYRATSQHDTAESEYALAFKIAGSRASSLVRADLNHRLAILRAVQKRYSEALELIDAAIRIYRKREHPRLAEALSKRGYILVEAERFAESIPYSGEALSLVDPKSSALAKRVHYAAVHNLGYALSQSPHPGTAANALPYIREAQRLLRGQRYSISRHRLQWIEARVWSRLMLDARAEQAFKMARRGFVRLEAPLQIALVSLDLAALYRTWNQWEDLETLAADTSRRFNELCADVEATAALLLWVEAVENRKGAAAAIDAARKVLETSQKLISS